MVTPKTMAVYITNIVLYLLPSFQMSRPNAAAMAEQLWSEPSVQQTVDKARTRLSQHRCRMRRRGTRAAPLAEDYCDDDLYVACMTLLYSCSRILVV